MDQAFAAMAKDIVDRLKKDPDAYGSEGGVSLKKDVGKKKDNEKAAAGCC